MGNILETSILQNHLVLFYAKEKPLWGQCAALISLAQPDVWLYISDEHTIAEVSRALKEHEIDVQQGEIQLSDTYFYRQAVVRIPAIISALRSKILDLQAVSSKSILLLLEMTWTIRTPSGAIYLREYEEAIHELSNEMGVVIACLYNKSIILDDLLMTAIQTHPLIVTSKGVIKNPHFLPPNIFARRNQRQQFNYWLEQIDPTLGLTDVSLIEQGDYLKNNTQSDIKKSNYNIDTPTILIATDTDQGRWKIRLLGELKVYRENGDSVDWSTKGGATRKLKTIFAYLLFKGDKGASVEELVDMLWADRLDLKVGANRLYHSIRYLRKILSPGLTSKTGSVFILNRDNRYFLAVPPDTWIDLPMFQELCYKGGKHLRNGDYDSAMISYQSAERLYRDDLLAGIPSKYIENVEYDWCWSRRYWFKDMNHKLLYELASIHRQLGNNSEALKYCDKALLIDPSSEKAHEEKMKTFFAAKRTDALNRQYRLYCKALHQFDMGEPSVSTRALFEGLINKI